MQTSFLCEKSFFIPICIEIFKIDYFVLQDIFFVLCFEK